MRRRGTHHTSPALQASYWNFVVALEVGTTKDLVPICVTSWKMCPDPLSRTREFPLYHPGRLITGANHSLLQTIAVPIGVWDNGRRYNCANCKESVSTGLSRLTSYYYGG